MVLRSKSLVRSTKSFNKYALDTAKLNAKKARNETVFAQTEIS